MPQFFPSIKRLVDIDIDMIVDALAQHRFQFFDLTTYDVFETYNYGSGSIFQGYGIAFAATGTTAGSCSRQNLNQAQTQFDNTYLVTTLYLGLMSGDCVGFVGMVYGVKLTETQNTSNLTTKHAGIFYENGQWYASVANGTNQTKVAITLAGSVKIKMDFRTAGHAKFYNGNTLLADITTNFVAGHGFFQWFVHNKTSAINQRLYFYNLINRDKT